PPCAELSERGARARRGGAPRRAQLRRADPAGIRAECGRNDAHGGQARAVGTLGESGPDAALQEVGGRAESAADHEAAQVEQRNGRSQPAAEVAADLEQELALGAGARASPFRKKREIA